MSDWLQLNILQEAGLDEESIARRKAAQKAHEDFFVDKWYKTQRCGKMGALFDTDGTRRTNGIADWRRLQSFESLELLPISCIGYIVLVSQIPASRCNSARSKISWMNCKTSTTMRRTDFKSMQVAVLLCGGSRDRVPWASAGNTCQATQGGGWYAIYGIIWWYNQFAFNFVFDSVSSSSPLSDSWPPNCEFDSFSNTFCHVRQCNRNLPLPKMLWMQPLLALEVGWNLKFTSHHFMTTSKGWW